MQLMSEQIDQLATALAKAQGEMPTAEKRCKNPFFKSMYADFEAIRDACVPSLSKYGLSFVQSPSEDESGFTYLVTQINHSSGQWMRSKVKISPPKNDIQSISSYTTYLKRMCLSSMVGVATGEADDDGEATIDRTNAQANSTYNQPTFPRQQIREPIMNLIAQEELDQLRKLTQATQSMILADYKVSMLEKLTSEQFIKIKSDLIAQREARERKPKEEVGN